MSGMRRLALAAVVACLVAEVVPSPAKAGVTYDFVFDDGGLFEPPPPVPPFVGSGTLTIAGSPGDGTFALDSLGAFGVSFTFGSTSFSNADIATPPGQVLVVLSATPAGQRFRFSNVSPFGDGPLGGSIDFVTTSGAALTFEPPGFGGLNLYAEYGLPGASAPQFSGNYLALSVPEPSSLALTISAVPVALVAWRRRRRRGD